jgi:hypothetical protein
MIVLAFAFMRDQAKCSRPRRAAINSLMMDYNSANFFASRPALDSFLCSPLFCDRHEPQQAQANSEPANYKFKEGSVRERVVRKSRARQSQRHGKDNRH